MVSFVEAPAVPDSSSIADFIKTVPASGLLVAYSGGLDSSVLLHLVSKAASATGLPVRAVHVDHKLHDKSGEWSQFCVEQCDALGIAITVVSVDVATTKDIGPEAAARDARYNCIAGVLRMNELLLTAHHLDDQAETFLLQAFRGAGLPGLSGMPMLTEFSKGFHARPLLGIPREALKAYAEEHRLNWIDDPSNNSLHFDRNYLRLQVFPGILKRWPGARQTLARATQHCSDGERIVAGACRSILGDNAIGPLQLDLLAVQDRSMAAALLRVWIRDNNLPVPSETKIRQVLDEVIPAGEDAEPEVTWSGGEIRRYRQRLYCMPRLPGVAEDLTDYLPLEDTALPLGGTIRWLESDTGGVRLETLQQSGWQLRFRRGGERIQPAGHAQHRELKKLFQEQGVLPWARNLLPLFFHNNQLIAVADLWLASEATSEHEGPLLRPVWHQRPLIIAK
ncbi:MAG: tRNA lysidine(34) synthetase TilS [Gammaproteobacteria bacterium]